LKQFDTKGTEMNWCKGSPEDFVNPFLYSAFQPTYWLLEFAEGDRFVVAKYVVENDKCYLETMDGGRITDPVKQHLQIPNPEGINQ
jgi:hypothetical protein